MQRLRPLNEQECYLRCYGWVGGSDDVTVRATRRRRAGGDGGLTERIRLAFEALRDEREAEAA